MSRPKVYPPRRALSVRVAADSALARLLYSPRGEAIGYSKRLHEIAEMAERLQQVRERALTETEEMLRGPSIIRTRLDL